MQSVNDITRQMKDTELCEKLILENNYNKYRVCKPGQKFMIKHQFGMFFYKTCLIDELEVTSKERKIY